MAIRRVSYLDILRNEPPEFEAVKTSFSYQPKLYLTALSMSDLEDMHAYSTVPEFFDYIDVDPSETIDDTRAYLNKLMARMETGYKNGHAMYWAIRLRETQKTIGTFCLIGIDFDKGIAEAGKGLSTHYMGMGYIFEAQWLVLNYAFNRLDLKSVSSFTHAANNPNIQLMKSAGYKQTGTEEIKFRDGSSHKFVTMTVTKKEATLDRCLAFAKMAQR